MRQWLLLAQWVTCGSNDRFPCYETEGMKTLRRLRRIFLTKQTVKQYIGYAQAQVSDQKRGKGVKTKKFYHALRLLNDAERIVRGEPPRVFVEGEEREYLMRVRRNEVTEDVLMQQFERRSRALYDGLDASGLPESVDRDVLSAWLVDMRRASLGRELAPVFGQPTPPMSQVN